MIALNGRTSPALTKPLQAIAIVWSMRLQHLSAIVADDQKASRDIAIEILRSTGMGDIRHARDGAEAFNLVRAKAPDLLILDLEMPRDGLSALRQVRTASNSPNRELAVIMMTGLTTHDRVVAMRDAGANEILAKPLTSAKLIGRIQNILLSPRPFIDEASYVGPDRRRGVTSSYAGPFRRAADRMRDIYEIA